MSFGFNFGNMGNMFQQARAQRSAAAQPVEQAPVSPVAANPQREGAAAHMAQRQAQFSDQANPSGFSEQMAPRAAAVRNNLAGPPNKSGGCSC